MAALVCTAAGQALHGRGEHVAAFAVVGEHVHRRRRRSQQHGVPRPGHARCSVHRRVHHCGHRPSVGPTGIVDGDCGRVSANCLGHLVPTVADRHHGPQPAGRGGDQFVEGQALAEAPGDPDHAVVRGQGRRGGMRVGGLGVVHPRDAGTAQNGGVSVRVRHKPLQTRAYRLRRHAVGAGQCRGRQGVGHVVRPGRPDLIDRGEGHRPVRARGVDEPAVRDAELAGGRRRERERDVRPRCAGEQSCGGLVVGVADRRSAAPDARFRGGVRLQAAVPVEVVGRDVEHRRGRRAQPRRPVQLEAGQLHREDVGRRVCQYGVDQRSSHVACRDGPPARGAQHGGEHPHGGGLAVGAGQREPRRGPGRT